MRISRVALRHVALLGLLSATLPVHGADLVGVEAASLSDGGTQIELRLDGPPGKPRSFSISSPARLVVDLPATGSALDTRRVPIDLGGVDNVAVVPADGRLRVIFSLQHPVAHGLEVRDNSLLVLLGDGPALAARAPQAQPPAPGVVAGTGAGAAPPPASSGATTTAAVPRPAPARAAVGDQITGVDFRRGPQGEGRVIVSLSRPDVRIDIDQESSDLIVDFATTSVPEEFARRLDVMDFGTAVNTLTLRPHDRGTRLRIDATGLFEHIAYQTGNTYVVEVRPRDEADDLAERGIEYTGEALSLNFQDIEVRAVLQLLADFTGKNLVASDSVGGTVTLRLQSVPWDQALHIILQAKGLAKREDGNVMWVAPAEEIAARERLDLETRRQLRELAPLYSEFLPVNFAKASDIAGLLKAEENKLLTERGSVTIDERTNTLIINDTEEKLAEIRNLMATLDVPIRQVLIESRIVNASTDFSKNLGVRFGASRFQEQRGYQTAISGNLNGTTQLLNGEDLEQADRLNVNLPAGGINGFLPSSLALAIAKLPFGRLLELELTALEAEGRGEVISNPRVVTSNQREAIIEQGTEIGYQEASASGATTTGFKEAVLSLRVVPQITPDNHVIMDLTVTKDSVGDVIAGEPSINTQSVTTQVLVDNGETIVIGGIYEQASFNQVTRTPFFGELPYVGRLFRNRTNSDEKSELLIFVTPKILQQGIAALL